MNTVLTRFADEQRLELAQRDLEDPPWLLMPARELDHTSLLPSSFTRDGGRLADHAERRAGQRPVRSLAPGSPVGGGA